MNHGFSPAINVFVGANGTGKSHLLKLLYCLQDSRTPNGNVFARKLKGGFRPKNDDVRQISNGIR
ncbi:MAG: ATP-binding protein [Magnetococcales bacterium]|nr:ATP-binding protein [Magnetococcales bacterium]